MSNVIKFPRKKVTDQEGIDAYYQLKLLRIKPQVVDFKVSKAKFRLKECPDKKPKWTDENLS